MNEIKSRYFGHDFDSPVVLHREGLVQRQGVFGVLAEQETRDRYNREIVSLFRDSEYRLIAVVIDKLAHQKRHGPDARHPYHYCVEAMLERYCMFLNKSGGKGDVYAEARGDKEDRMLLEEWARFLRSGTAYWRSARVKALLSSESLQLRKKLENIPGLQLADLLAFTSTQDVLIDEGRQERFKDALSPHIAKAIAAKYDTHSQDASIVRGCGKVLLK